ncbi:hypothetical protein F5Y09DRAFT_325322 [Xylaria sp. FL1042]|nr:hypothetical protein F5Y09DRAFT_325322 [Xylaria sp. FL1042]
MSVLQRKLPTVTLDATLTDLYRRAGPTYAHKRIAQVMGPVHSAIQLTSKILRNVKYTVQDSAFNDPAAREDGAFEISTEARRELAISYVALVGQRDGFLSGDTLVIMFDSEVAGTPDFHDEMEAKKTMAVLSENQRPRLLFCSGYEDIPAKIKDENIDLMAYKLAPDALQGYAQALVVPLDTAWYLNSKEALVTSGLPAPRCDIIEVDEPSCFDADHCCDVCRRSKSSGDFLIPVDCTGPRGRWYSEQSTKIYGELSGRALPFVVKNQQSYGGAGTYLIYTDKDRAKLLQDLHDGGVLRRTLSSVTKDNKHLRPASIILSELIENPIGTWGLSFFVTEDADEPMFLAVTELMLVQRRFYIGSSVQYNRQAELKSKFTVLVKDMSRWLRSFGYIGPVGVDVLETASTSSYLGERSQETQNSNADRVADGDGCSRSSLHILDINARTSGQLCLPLLRTHFTSRGFECAASFFVRTSKTRKEFIDMFQEGFGKGKTCILSWYDDPVSNVSFGNVVVGAEDINALGGEVQRIRNISQEVSF